MSKQRVVLSLILVNGKRELLGFEEMDIQSSCIKQMEKHGQRFVSQSLQRLVRGCEDDTKPPPRLHHD